MTGQVHGSIPSGPVPVLMSLPVRMRYSRLQHGSKWSYAVGPMLTDVEVKLGKLLA